MGICGVIAEFNPLHNGHKYLIENAKKDGDTVVCVLSGSFVQRGEPAFTLKWDRAKTALKCGCDLCIELPTPWSMSTAANFAFGSIGLLKQIGAEKIIFGSECGDIKLLLKTADILQNDEFLKLTKEHLKSGKTFAVARQAALEQTHKECGKILTSPNDTLAIEYILAARRQNYSPYFIAVKRVGAKHDSICEDDTVSASFIRQSVNFNPKHMPPFVYDYLNTLKEQGRITDYAKLDNMVLSALRLKDKESFSSLPDVSEGIENCLIKAVKDAKTLDELYLKIKSKRYTHARIRRLCMSAFLKLDNSFYFKNVPYIRPLGFNSTGEAVLKHAAKNSAIPVLSRVKNTAELDNFAKSVFAAEQRATDIFALTLKEPMPAGLDYTQKIIKL